MNYEYCDNYYHVKQDNLKDSPTFKTCLECANLLVLIPSKSNIRLLLETKIIFQFLDNPPD